jgi:predicted transport protein
VSDIKLFRLTAGVVAELQGETHDLERPLQTLMEGNLDALLGIRFLASEYSTGKTHGGRIDTLGLDENYSPVIIEYKRSMAENVINQGLFYLDWLMDHKGEFQLLVQQKLGAGDAESIDWSGPRLVCIAADFTKYDGHAVQQINRNIDLIRYRKFGSELLLLELVNAVSAQPGAAKAGVPKAKQLTYKPVAQGLAELPGPLMDLFDSLDGYLMSLGDDVQRKDLKLYIAFKRLKNFVCVEAQKGKLLAHTRLNPDTVGLVEGFTRDMRQTGHWGTGDLEISLRTPGDLDRAKPLFARAYEGT